MKYLIYKIDNLTDNEYEKWFSLMEEDKQESVRKAMEDLLYVPFEFENSGTRVIHYTPEMYEKR